MRVRIVSQGTAKTTTITDVDMGSELTNVTSFQILSNANDGMHGRLWAKLEMLVPVDELDVVAFQPEEALA